MPRTLRRRSGRLTARGGVRLFREQSGSDDGDHGNHDDDDDMLHAMVIIAKLQGLGFDSCSYLLNDVLLPSSLPYEARLISRNIIAMISVEMVIATTTAGRTKIRNSRLIGLG